MSSSAGIRFVTVGLLALLMYIPLFLVGEVVGERADYQRQTIRAVGQDWGGEQVIAGPVMVVPVEGPVTRTERRDVTDPVTGQIRTLEQEVTEVQRKAPLYLYPGRFDAALATLSDERRRGIFRVPVYSATAAIGFDFAAPDLTGLVEADETVLWEAARLDIALASNRALRGVAELTSGSREFAMEPMAGGQGITASLGDPRQLGPLHLDLGFNGAGGLFIAPVGRASEITMTSDWPSPSFTGAFLPNTSQVSDAGFAAQWSIPHLARALPQAARQDYTQTAQQEALGVRFYQPNDFYQKAYRAAHYGLLFIALTFLTVLLIEGRSGRPAHPVQYIFIGLAQSIFVLLMASYAEQIGFGAAYLVTSVATVALLVVFGAIGLKLGRRTWVLGAMLTLLYGVLYLILRSEDYALIAGATLAFVALAITMIVTRNEDWQGPEGTRWPLFSAGPKPPPLPTGPAGGSQAELT